MSAIDPLTGEALPPSALQRILFLSPKVHVYNIPPLPSTKGHQASSWTADPARHIFTARLRVLETSDTDDPDPDVEKITATVVLEDPSTGTLFAAAPYAHEADVEPVIDSSRFFAVTVRDGAGRKAVLGIGFEERGEAFDFGVALQEVRKSILGPKGTGLGQREEKKEKEEEKRDLSLKEGETITVSFGGRFGRRTNKSPEAAPSGGGDLSAFSLPPPPTGASGGHRGGGGSFSLPPPPAAGGVQSNAFIAPPTTTTRAQDAKQQSKSAQELGFDDGQFGEFA